MKNIHIDKIPYYTYKSLIHNKTYRTKSFYDNCFYGDIRQIMYQSKLDFRCETDNFLSKNNVLSHIVNNNYINLSDVSLFNILLESYINFDENRKKEFALRMNTVFINYKTIL